MRIAIVGSGISGLGAAYLLSAQHDVSVFEANDYIGGHTHTHDIEVAGKSYAVDTGFIVFNPAHYPNLIKLFAELAVASQPTIMSFGINNARSGVEYNATNLNSLFCQRQNLFKPSFLRMAYDITRFYREAKTLLNVADPGPSLGEYLIENRYSRWFRDDHIVPMASELWSSPSTKILEFPAKYLVQFMDNHRMMDLGERAAWSVVCGGSQTYVRALLAKLPANVHLNAPVSEVRRGAQGASLKVGGETLRFDQVIFACHSDQALKALGDPSDAERELLSALKFQENETILHTDTSLMPRTRKAWAAWNAHLVDPNAEHCTVTYWMNLLQGIQAPVEFLVSLNCAERIDPSKILRRMRYHHPVYTQATVAAQRRRNEINGVNSTWYCGAYWGFGFHEDGLRSAVEVARGLGVVWQ